MRIKAVRVYRFRNLTDQEIAFSNRITLIVGENGQGKTNLLEAIYLLAQAKSFRNTRPADLICWDAGKNQGSFQKNAAITGFLENDEGEKKISFVVENGKGKVFVNEKRTVRASLFYGQLKTVLFTADDLLLVKGAPELRRQFLDRTHAMVDQAFVDHLVSYERALRSRNEILRAMKKSPKTESTENALRELSAWDEVLIEHGREIAKRRNYFCDALQESFKKHYEFLSSCAGPLSDDSLEEKSPPEGTLEAASLEYKSKFFSGGELLSVDRLRELYVTSRVKDQHFGQTSFGVHRDDLSLILENTYGERMAKLSASQGQMRSLVLALKFSALDFLEREEKDEPVLLLDDVESELDDRRRNALYELLTKKKNQIVITANRTSEEFKNYIKHAQILTISRGCVKSSQEWKN